MGALEIVFWIAAGCVVYTYLGYPLLLLALATFRRRTPKAGGPLPQSVSIVVAAHNEEANLTRRLDELTRLIAATKILGEIILVSDGSTDRTAKLAREFAGGKVRVLELPCNVGKAEALTQGCALAQNEILVFADARQTWDAGALGYLLENFTDTGVGAVSGDLMFAGGAGVLGGVALYWGLEKWLRKQESRLHSSVGVTGAICAVRRELFRPIPKQTILDDVYWPLQVVMQGYRVVHDCRAHAYDRLPDRTSDEFRRKVRTLSGNFQLVKSLPTVLIPWRNPVWFQFWSHKLLRLLVPWALLTLIGISALLPGPFYQSIFWLQLGFYFLALVEINPWSARLGIGSTASSFLVLNSAAWLAFWVWITGKSTKSWHKVSYNFTAAGCSTNIGFPLQ